MSKYEAQVRNVQRAAAALDELKIAAGCIDCGFAAWPEALHFDHLDPRTKLRSLGWVSDRSRLTSKAKLKRFLSHVDEFCEIRCANCHAHRSMVNQHWRPVVHDDPDAHQHPTLY